MRKEDKKFMNSFNENKFTGKAAVYSKYRPTYPSDFIDYLYTQTGFTKESVIADIGAGTGIFSELLAGRKSNVICVEPNEDMLNAAKQNLKDFPKCEFVNKSAENTGISDNSVDFVTVAQAFHWFDAENFKTECKRILKENGAVILVWNIRIESDELTLRTAEINKKYCRDFTGFSGGINNDLSKIEKFFNNNYEIQEFQNDLIFDEDGFIGRNLSSSYAPKESDANYKIYIEEMRKIFNEYGKDGKVTVLNVTRCYIGKL